jgi:hypothetical protein
MCALKFHTKPSFNCLDEDLSDGAFVWASKCITGQDAVEEFVSCGVWPLAAGVDFEHVKVGETPVSKLKVPLPRFPLCRQDDEDDTELLARVEQEARVIVNSYMHTEHKACIAGLRNNGRLNHVIELAGVVYGPRPVPVFVEVMKKRKEDAAEKVAKHLKVPEKKHAGAAKIAAVADKKRSKTVKVTMAPKKRRTETAKVAMTQSKGGLKRSSDMDIALVKSAKLSKSIVPHTIASVAVARITHEARGTKMCLVLRALKPVVVAQAQRP